MEFSGSLIVVFVDLLVCLVWVGFGGCLVFIIGFFVAAMFICLLLLFVYDCFSIFAEKVLCLSASE